jgi:phosphatidylserine/phosphatidylglycerophosphate/cardiolipin synthase-like enzyme
MKRIPVLIFFFVWAVVASAPLVFADLNTSVCFTPGDNCTDRIVQEIDKAQSVVLVQAFSFTSSPLAKALVRARERGVEVKVILDRKNFLEEFTQGERLLRAGVPILLDGEHQTAHNKVMILDGKTVITGSFNFTQAAEKKNAENMLILRDPDLVRSYTENWKTHEAHSINYVPKSPGLSLPSHF